MEVVAFLPPPLLSHLRVVLSRGHSLTAVPSWDSLDEVVRHRVVDVAVIDVQADENGTAMGVRAFLSRHPTMPLVVYTTLSPSSLQGIVELAKHGVEHVVLHRFDDDPRRFLELLERLPGTAGRRVAGTARRLLQVTPEVAQAGNAFSHAPRFNDTPDLAAAAGPRADALPSWTQRVRPPRMLSRSRLLMAYHTQGRVSIQGRGQNSAIHPARSAVISGDVGLLPSDREGRSRRASSSCSRTALDVPELADG